MTHANLVTADPVPHQMLALLRDAPEGSCYDDLLDDFVRSLEPTICSIAANLTKVFCLDRTVHGDEVLSRVYETAADLVREVRNGKIDLSEVDSYTSLLRFRAKSKVRRWIDASAAASATPTAEADQKRRIWEMHQTRGDLFADLGRAPSMNEVLDATNARTAAPLFHGRRVLVCTEDDWNAMNRTDTVPTGNDSLRGMLIGKVIDECRKADAETGHVAEVFYAPALTDEYDGHASLDEIAAATGISAETARRHLVVVQATAKRALFERFEVDA